MTDHLAVDYTDVMLQFRKGFARADADLLAGAIGDGFEWHTHTFSAADPVPTGRVLFGLDEMMAEIHRRREHWTDVWFDGMTERYAPLLVTQTFTISGNDDGVPFNVAAVDLYTLNNDELIIKKDTYWKHAAAS